MRIPLDTRSADSSHRLWCGIPASLCVLLFLTIGCATQDPAKFIARHCPVQWVDTDNEWIRAVDEGPRWTGGPVKILGECYYDARAIRSWAQAHGIPCAIVSTSTWIGFREIPDGHWSVAPEDSRYLVDYVEGRGLVWRRREPEDRVIAESSPIKDTEPWTCQTILDDAPPLNPCPRVTQSLPTTPPRHVD